MSSGETATLASALVDVLGRGDSLAIVAHDNPDPDCIASALALTAVAEENGVQEVQVMYSGEVSHQQNRAFVNLLDVELLEYSTDLLHDYDLIAFVDHSVKGANNHVPEDTHVDIVIDHHPPEEEVDAEFVDVREGFGATTTIMANYLRELQIEPDQGLATAMLFAIRTETLDFLRGTTPEEYSAAKYLHQIADISLLKEMIRPAFTPQTIDTIGEAIRNREIRASSLISGVGRTTERDAIPQAADYLMNLEGVATVLVFGIVEDEIQISARSNDTRINLDRVVREAYGDVGSAGGHREMAGAQIPLGIFSEMTGGDEKLVDLTSDIVKKRFFQVMNLSPDQEEEEPEEEEE